MMPLRQPGLGAGVTGMRPESSGRIAQQRERQYSETGENMNKLLTTLLAAAFATMTFNAVAQTAPATPATPAAPAKADAAKATPATPATPAAKADAPKKEKAKADKPKKAKADQPKKAKADKPKKAPKAEAAPAPAK
jgi:outer membrane biosynthesis protein TonB